MPDLRRLIDPASYVEYGRGRWNRALAGSRLDALARAGDHARKLADVVRAARRGDVGASADWIERIEEERAALLARDEPLVGAEAGEVGPYDEGQTVARACGVSKRRGPATALHLIVREFAPESGLELGTNLGVSSSYQAAAMTMTGAGSLVTCEGSPARSAIARSVHQRLDLTNVSYVVGLFSDTLAATLESVGELDYAFIDGHHQKQPTLDYFDAIWPHLADRSVVVFDDIRWSPGMREAWRILQADPRFSVVADLDIMGVGITTTDPGRRHVTGVIPL